MRVSEAAAPRDEVDNPVLGPVAVVFSGRRPHEAAVPAVRAELNFEARVARQLRVSKRLRRNERIVFGGDDERGDADALDDPHGACAVVVVVGALEPEVWRRVDLVELADGPDSSKGPQIEAARPEPVLAPHPSLQILDEIPLVEPVARLFERPHALADLDD